MKVNIVLYVQINKLLSIFSISITIDTHFGVEKNHLNLIETVLFEYPKHIFWLRNKKKEGSFKYSNNTV